MINPVINLWREHSTLLLGLGLILGVPSLVIVLGELIERFRRNKNPLAQVLSATRNLVLPPLVVWLVLRHFFNVPDGAIGMRVIASLCWIVALYTLLILLNAALATGKKQRLWQIHIPNLLFQLLRTVVVLSLVAYVLAQVWNVDLSQVIGALGIGSLVIALALQDTLSNLVSGFLLIIEGPFKVGDWIRVGDLEGEVIEINWRAVRIKTLDRDILIIPNGNLGKENICNYTLIDPLHAVRLNLKFSYQEHPDQVSAILKSVAYSVRGIQTQPAPQIEPKTYSNTYIEYEIRFFITHYSLLEKIEGEFLTRAYYAIRRHRLQVPFADKVEYKLDQLPVDTENTPEFLAEVLRSLPIFAPLDRAAIQQLAQSATVELFGSGERIIHVGVVDPYFYVVLAGHISLTSPDKTGTEQEIAYLSQGDFLGEMVFLPGEPSSLAATVVESVKVIRIEPAAIAQLIQRYPKLALEMSQFIDERKKVIRIAQGIEH